MFTYILLHTTLLFLTDCSGIWITVLFVKYVKRIKVVCRKFCNCTFKFDVWCTKNYDWQIFLINNVGINWSVSSTRFRVANFAKIHTPNEKKVSLFRFIPCPPVLHQPNTFSQTFLAFPSRVPASRPPMAATTFPPHSHPRRGWKRRNCFTFHPLQKDRMHPLDFCATVKRGGFPEKNIRRNVSFAYNDGRRNVDEDCRWLLAETGVSALK